MFTPSAEIAKIVLDRYLIGTVHPSSERVRMPRGFRTLGSGISRQAVLAPDGIVYKVGDEGDNAAEEYNITDRLSSYTVRGAEVLIPQAQVFNGRDGISVIAMEFMERARGYRRYCFDYYHPRCTAKFQGECINRFYAAVSEVTSIEDIHSDNLLRLGENTFALVDLAF